MRFLIWTRFGQIIGEATTIESGEMATSRFCSSSNLAGPGQTARVNIREPERAARLATAVAR